MATTRETTREAAKNAKKLQEKQMKEERMREVFLLVEHLVSHEEITIKLIIDCLLDVGSVNFINRRFQRSLLKQTLKAAVGVSKPVLKVIAFRWFKRNCPQLITNWLYLKVSFPEVVKPPAAAPKVAVPDKTTDRVALVEPERLNYEIQRLRGQVKLLSGISLGAIAALSGVLVWLNARPEVKSSHQSIPPAQTTLSAEDPIVSPVKAYP